MGISLSAMERANTQEMKTAMDFMKFMSTRWKASGLCCAHGYDRTEEFHRKNCLCILAFLSVCIISGDEGKLLCQGYWSCFCLLQHIPDKGFRLIRYYGFLANRIRSKYLPTVYNLLNQPERNALKIQWPELMIASFGIDPLCCPRCGTRMIRMSLMPGRSLAELLTIHESWVIRPAIAA